MTAGVYNGAEIEQGADFVFVVYWKDANMAAIDLSDFTGQAMFRYNINDTDPAEVVSTQAGDMVIDGLLGKTTITIPGARTSNLIPGSILYDIKLTDTIPPGRICRELRGQLPITAAVTR